ncbi:carboxypeptidase M32 [Alkaliphilus transvaalensis]|uniref:carboxypeptidase M32 n=1 Tax=Alkaliphilus transvaalensis TaxID=114628 RepID=UPI00047A2F2B|nr:carboxypeptidase M32 [Alkaliphilus transvaalensis]
MRDLQSTIEQYLNLTKKRNHFMEATGLMSWDLHTNAPKGAVEGRSQVIGTMASEMLKISTSPEMENLLNELLQEENFQQLPEIIKKSVVEEHKQFSRNKKIPQEKFMAYKILTSKAQAVWQEAKGKNDFNLFLPYLEEIIQYNRQMVELWGYQEHPYDALLDQYEPGMTVKILDEIFSYLKEETIKLLDKINESSNTPDISMFNNTFDIEKQKQISLRILHLMGYDFNRGRMDVSAHPFTIGLNLGDVRVTTNFAEDSFQSAFYASIHEGGHGIYNQNLPIELRDTNLCKGTSTGIHESQSRYWENVVGRSKGFWKFFEEEVKETFPQQFKKVTTDEIYRAINVIQPSLVRIFADEVTYNLHIIVRYELEKDLISGKIQVKDLPTLWNNKMEEYLGIRPEKDSEGVLQDMHWSGGMLGYFPTYSLGNIYAAQFTNQMKKDLANYHNLVETGDFKEILKWLKDNIHCYGRLLEPSELVEKVTGEGINPKHLIQYLKEKYSEIYQVEL